MILNLPKRMPIKTTSPISWEYNSNGEWLILDVFAMLICLFVYVFR